MEVMYKNCCGLDVHKKIIWACLLKGKKSETRSFGTSTKNLRELAQFLKDKNCEMVAMEATGVLHFPVINVLEDEGVNYLVSNARDIKNVPGRKTDVGDCEWIASLVKHGLMRASYIPLKDQRELRNATRYRSSLIAERARELNRMQKDLEISNIKLSSLVSDIMGKSAFQLLNEVVNGNGVNEGNIDSLITTNLAADKNEIILAMDGVMSDLQKQLLRHKLNHIVELDKLIIELDREIKERTSNHEEVKKRLQEMPGIGERTSEIIVVEAGTDMSKFKTEDYFCSWIGLCPGNNESAGKKKNCQSRKGNKALKTALIQAAKSINKKESFFKKRKERISVRRGKNRATVAVAHSMAKSIYFIIKNEMKYEDLGSDFYNQFNPEKKAKSLLKRLKELGYQLPELSELQKS